MIPIFYFWIALFAAEFFGMIRIVIFTIGGKRNMSVNRILFIIPLLLIVFSVTITGVEIYLFYPLLIRAQTPYDASYFNAQWVLIISSWPTACSAALIWGHYYRRRRREASQSSSG